MNARPLKICAHASIRSAACQAILYFSNKKRYSIILLTGTLHGQSFACTCHLLTNRRVAPNVDNLQAARWLVNGRQAQAKACSCRVLVTDTWAKVAYTCYTLKDLLTLYLNSESPYVNIVSLLQWGRRKPRLANKIIYSSFAALCMQFTVSTSCSETWSTVMKEVIT